MHGRPRSRKIPRRPRTVMQGHQSMTTSLAIRDSSDGCTLPVRVHPGARRNAITGIHDGALKVSLTTPPTDGRANQTLIATSPASCASRAPASLCSPEPLAARSPCASPASAPPNSAPPSLRPPRNNPLRARNANHVTKNPVLLKGTASEPVLSEVEWMP